MKINHPLISGLTFLFLLSGCHTPNKMAKEFILNEKMPDILYISSPAIYSEFYRPDELRDSLNYFKPEKIMYYLDDTFFRLFPELYDSMLVNGLKNTGFRVFEQDSLADFFSCEGQKWQFSLQQISFEEHRLIYEDEITFDEYSIVWDTVVSEYQFNVWFELLPVNADSSVPRHVFFASASIVDELKGRFVYDWGKGVYDYVYSFSEVEVDDLYLLIANSAITHSDYLFDFFINRYLHFSIPDGKNMGVYYTWDRMKQKLLPAGTARFIFL